MLRTYHTDSPQAAARVVALALMSDGHVGRPELERLAALDAPARLGLTEAEWHGVLHGLCEDLLACTRLTWAGTAEVDPGVLQQLLADVSEPTLRETVLDLCVAAAEADDCVSDGEEAVLVAAVEHWGLQSRMLARAPT